MKTVEFVLGPNELQSLNREMQRVVEPGTFKNLVGGDSRDLIDTRLTVISK